MNWPGAKPTQQDDRAPPFLRRAPMPIGRRAVWILGVAMYLTMIHDLRHEATTRLFENGLNIMEVASITGHKDLRMLRRYTHLKAEDLAKKLG